MTGPHPEFKAQRIIDRDYQVESVKRVLEGIDKGHRKFLIVKAFAPRP